MKKTIKTFPHILVFFSLCFLVLGASLSIAQGNFPYFSNFESNSGGLVGTGSWEWGLPFSGPPTAHSDFLLWGTNLSDNYPDNADDYVDLPPIDLSTASSVRLSFWHWYEFEADNDRFFDGGNVTVSVNGGAFVIVTPFFGYDGVIDSPDNPLDGEPAFGGLNGRFWQKEFVILDKFVGDTIVIRFQMASDFSVNYAGWYIDDVSVAENLENDVAALSIDHPGDFVDLNLAPYVPQITVYNAGTKSQNFETEVTIWLNGNQEYVSTKTTNNLVAITTSQVSFDPWTPSGNSGTYELSVRTLLAGDEESYNDSLSIKGEVFEKDFSVVTALAGLDAFNAESFAWGDYNGDRFVDLQLNNDLFKNNRDGTFQRDVDSLVARDVQAPGHWGDYDQDGDLDLFLPGNYRNTVPKSIGLLFRQHNGNFVDVGDEIGFQPFDDCCVPMSIWLDYDNNGYLDLLISLAARSHHLYHNNGDGTFTEVTSEARLNLTGTGRVTAIDYDDDGFVDLMFHNGPSRLYHNTGIGTFEEVTAQAGIRTNVPSNGAAFGDYDNDGKLDLFLYHSWLSPSSRLYHNHGDGTFTDLATQAGVDEIPWPRGPSSWADYDNDGFLDLLIIVGPNESLNSLQLYHNSGDGTFSLSRAMPEIYSGNLSKIASWADFDNDGDLDLFVGRRSQPGSSGILYRNNHDNRNNWLIVQLIGTESNTNGYGARLQLMAEDLLQVRQINGGSGQRQESLRAHFGLGNAHIVDSLEVRWPSGTVDLIPNIEVNQIITITEGNGLTGVARENVGAATIKSFSLAQNYPNPFNPETRISFKISDPVWVRLTIYNLLGEKVIMLVDEKRNPGEFVEHWQGRDTSGKMMPSGLYVYRLDAGEFVANRKMLFLR